jgi:hypothetical protein
LTFRSVLGSILGLFENLEEGKEKKRMKLEFLCVFFALPLVCQVTSVDTEGKGGVDVFTSCSKYPGDQTVYSCDALLMVGLTDRLDIMAGPALSVGIVPGVFRAKQWAVEVGVQYKLLETKSGWRLTTLDLATLALSDRQDGTHTLFLSLTVSKDVSIHGLKFAPYGGYAPKFSMGANIEDKLLSYKDGIHNFPVGVMIPWRRLETYIEYGIRQPDYFSVGLSYNLRKK